MRPSSTARQLSERIEHLYIQALCDKENYDELIDPVENNKTPWPLFFVDIGEGPQIVRLREWGKGIVELWMEHAEGLKIEFPIRIGVSFVTDTLHLLGDDGRVNVLSCNALYDENPEVPDILARYVLQHLYEPELPSDDFEPRVFVLQPLNS